MGNQAPLRLGALMDWNLQAGNSGAGQFFQYD